MSSIWNILSETCAKKEYNEIKSTNTITAPANTSSDTKISLDELSIKHLVFSGGGPAGLISYGACKHLHEKKVWELKNIKSIYGTSIGALVGLIVSLGYEWNILDDYLIKRPWNKVFKLSLDNFLNCFYEKGLLGREVIFSLIGPLFKAKELDINITFGELYNYTGIELHMYTANINNHIIELVDLSHLTHKELSVCNGLCMSMSYPFVFKPVIMDNICYIDGGILNNFPLSKCLEQQKCNEADVLAFKTNLEKDDESVKDDSSMADYIYILIRKIQRMLGGNDSQKYKGEYIVNCFAGNLMNLNDWMNAVSDEDSRCKLIKDGDEFARIFYDETFLKSSGNIINSQLTL
jgi:predicted acylesterase/phospholipase RssA